MVKISNYEEKKWVLAYFMKRQKGIRKERIFRNWTGWWKEDFIPEDGYKRIKVYRGELHNWNVNKDHCKNEEYTRLLNEIEDFVKDTVSRYSIDQIKEILYQIKRKSEGTIPLKVKNKANKLGYKVSMLSANKRYPLRVVGYYICKGNKIIYGKSRDLELSDVEKFLSGEENKK